MITIKGTTINLTRGDTLKLRLNLSDSEGVPYTPSDDDIVMFGMKKSYLDTECLIEKVVPVDTLLLHISPEDTKSLEFGSYVWDCQIQFANGDVNTFITKAVFNILEEVV